MITKEKSTIKDEIKEILLNTVFDYLEDDAEEGFFDTYINAEEFDSLKIVEFMLGIEEAFDIYIDEESMAGLDFSDTYQTLVDGIEQIVVTRRAGNV